MAPIRLLMLGDSAEPQLRALKEFPEDVHWTLTLAPDIIRLEAPQADVILSACFSGDPFQLAWPLAERVRWVHTLSAGVEHLLTPEFAASPVPLTNSRGVYKRSLAEFALLGILYFAKDIPRMLANQRAGRWEPFEITEAHGKTVGIVGYGEIGRASAQLAHGLGMRVLALRRRTALSDGDSIADATFGPDALASMLAQCDYVVVAAPGTPETRGMIGAPEFAVMKSSAVMINIGRGSVIAEAPLLRALQEGRLRGAALDVFENEPLPEGHPFFSMPNVLVSPHSADRTSDWLEQSARFFLGNFERFRKGEPLENIVDKKASY